MFFPLFVNIRSINYWWRENWWKESTDFKGIWGKYYCVF